MSDKEKIKDWVKNLKSQASTIPNLGINALAGFQLACDDVIAFIDSLQNEDSSDECPCCGWALDSDGCCGSCGYGRK